MTAINIVSSLLFILVGVLLWSDSNTRLWRFISEKFTPIKKCRRIGHDYYIYEREHWPDKHHAQTQKRVECKHCGHCKTDWKKIDEVYFNHVSWTREEIEFFESGRGITSMPATAVRKIHLVNN